MIELFYRNLTKSEKNVLYLQGVMNELMMGRNIGKTNNTERACAENEKTSMLTLTFRTLLIDVLLAITLSVSAARLLNISPYMSFSSE